MLDYKEKAVKQDPCLDEHFKVFCKLRTLRNSIRKHEGKEYKPGHLHCFAMMEGFVNNTPIFKDQRVYIFTLK